MKTMPTHEAKNSFDLMIDTTHAEPVRIERHVRGVVIVVSVEGYKRLKRDGHEIRLTKIRGMRHDRHVHPPCTSPAGYVDWLANIRTRLHTAQQRTALAVNRKLVLLYWQIDRDILTQQSLKAPYLLDFLDVS